MFWPVPHSSTASNTQAVFYFLAKTSSLNSATVSVIPGPQATSGMLVWRRLWAAPRPWASVPLGATCPQAPHTVPSHLQLPVSPISSPPRGLLAVCTVMSSAAVMAAEPEAPPDTQQTPSPPGSCGLKETIVFEILSLRFLDWLQGKQQPLLVEGDTGFASRWVEDFVVRTRPWAQPGLVAVTCGHGLLGTACFSRASLLTGLFSG